MSKDIREIVERAQKFFDESQRLQREKHLETVRNIGDQLMTVVNVDEIVSLQKRLGDEITAFHVRSAEAQKEFNLKIEHLMQLQAEFETQVSELVHQGILVETFVSTELSVTSQPTQMLLPELPAATPIRTVADELDDPNTPPAMREQLMSVMSTVSEKLSRFHRVETFTVQELFGLNQELTRRSSDTPQQKIEWMLSHLCYIRDTPALWFSLDKSEQSMVSRAIKLERHIDNDESLSMKGDSRAMRLAKLIMRLAVRNESGYLMRWAEENGDFRAVQLRSYLEETSDKYNSFLLLVTEIYIVDKVRGSRLPVQIQNTAQLITGIIDHYRQLKEQCPPELLESLQLGGKIRFFHDLLRFYKEKNRLTVNQLNKAVELTAEYVAMVQTVLESMIDVLPVEPTKKLIGTGE